MNGKPRKKRVRLILNGKAAGNEALRNAIARHREVGHRIDVRVTWEKGDAQRFVSEAGRMDLVIAAGGDGRGNDSGQPGWRASGVFELRYEAVSKAIRVIVPPNCPLLSTTAG